VADYTTFLENKGWEVADAGFVVDPSELCGWLYPFQRDIVHWALRRGKAAIFADCGLGKTPMQLAWAQHVVAQTGGRALILAPLAVNKQTQREGDKFGVAVHDAREGDLVDGVNIANYEMMEHCNPAEVTALVLDESSILKSYSGRYRTELIRRFGQVPYKLACTATPAPNDYMELGNHAEFLGAMTRMEMLGMFFINDATQTQQWRLKGHCAHRFWEWMAEWAVVLDNPATWGYDGEGFALPAKREHIHLLASSATEGLLFAEGVTTLTDRRQARKASLAGRAQTTAELVEAMEGPVLVWVNYNYEADALRVLLPEAVEIRGSDDRASKEQKLLGFARGDYRVLITKPRIAGFGLNWQHCWQMIFCGISDSYEQYYQAMRRCWRFGQKRPVDIHIVIGEREETVWQNVQRKEHDNRSMRDFMTEATMAFLPEEMRQGKRSESVYRREVATDEGGTWTMHLGDCVEVVSEMESESIDYSVFSPPFADLYVYSDSTRDMGNSSSFDEFFDHFGFLVPELLRVTKAGRNVSFHCMNLPVQKQREGFIGLRDFRGELIRLFIEQGWIYHSEVCIWKDPVTAMQRTKALGLLHKQILKDSCMSRQGIADYLVTMRKPGENATPVSHTRTGFPVDLWQKWASPIWSDINMSRTLQKTSARAAGDEKHICPLQLDVIERAVALWSNPGDLVLSPFAGIGSEGYQSLLMGRRFVGVELKESYYQQACNNLRAAVVKASEGQLFTC